MRSAPGCLFFVQLFKFIGSEWEELGRVYDN
jgi:hypothetical protein